jgi:epoxyqueuosine reductase
MSQELAELVKAWAGELGFSQCGIAKPEPSHYRHEFLDWLQKRRHGCMEYMERNTEKRLDPRLLMEDVQSIVVAAMQYLPPETPPRTGDAKFARYARNLDYHDVLKPRLMQLLERIRQHEPSATGRVYVDTGPILEREIAVSAGLGWIGKNTMLLNPRHGSWSLLGILLLNLPLPADAPINGNCGSCTRCLDACPTSAFVGPNQLDATRCISYHTIESRDAIPDEIAVNMRGWVFGCDICQEVCPVGKTRIVPTSEQAFHPRQTLDDSRLTNLLAMTEEQFRGLFRRSPVKRAKWRGLMRNVAAALSTSDDPDADNALTQALQHPEELVREQAAKALQIRRMRSTGTGCGAAEPSGSPDTRPAADMVLDQCRPAG